MTSYIHIYTPESDQRAEYPVTRDSEVSCTLMGDCFVKVVFNHPNVLNFRMGSYILYKGRKWTMLNSGNPVSLSNANGYKYELKFYAEQHQLQRCRSFGLKGLCARCHSTLPQDCKTLHSLFAIISTLSFRLTPLYM